MEEKKKHELKLFDYIQILLKWKKFLLITIFSIAIISTLIAFLLPHWFRSTASIKPASKSNISLFSAILGSKGLSSLGKSLNIGGLQYSDLDYYISLLNSRRILLKMISKFHLKQKYNEEFIFKTIDDLLNNSSFEADPTSNTLIISVIDKNPHIAMEMVGYYIQLLWENLTELSQIELNNAKSTIGKRYKQNLKDLGDAENKLKLFQEKYGVVLPKEQFISTIEVVTKIEAQKLLLEAKLATITKIKGIEAPSAKDIKIQIDVLQNKLVEMNQKIKIHNSDNLYVSYKFAPELINKYVKCYRNVKLQATLLEYLYPLYEQTKMQQEDKSLNFLVIDKPNLPEYKVKPKRAIIILTGIFLGAFFSIIFIFLSEYIKKQKNEFKK